MACIYQYVNKLNGHMYIGLTKNLQCRHNEHCQAAKNPNNRDYNLIFHKTLRKHGPENFDYNPHRAKYRAVDRDIISELYQESGLSMRVFREDRRMLCWLWNFMEYDKPSRIL